MIAQKLQVFRKGSLVSETDLAGVEAELNLGRGERCEIRLDDRAVSRRHASLRLVQSGVQIDKKSDFGVLKINGQEVEHAILKLTDTLQIGPFDLKLVSLEPLGQDKKNVEPPSSMDHLRKAEIASVPEPSLSVASEGGVELGAESAELISLGGAPSGDGLSLFGGEEQSQGVQSEESVENSLMGDEGQASVLDQDSQEVAGSEGNSELEAEPQEEEVIDLGSIDSDGATRVVSTAQVRAVLVFNEGKENTSEFEIQSDEVSIGRGKDCDVVLEDKKASKKNSIITRQGAKFRIKDLASSNGTFVNGEKIEEAELSGDDLIKIGNTEFRLRLLSNEFNEKKAEFLEVPQEPEFPPAVEEFPIEDDQAIELPPPDTNYAASLEADLAQSPEVGPPSKTGLAGLLEKVRALPKTKQLALGFLVGGLAFALAMPEEFMALLNLEEPKPKASVIPAPLSRRSFANLRPELRQIVEQEHALASEHFSNRNYKQTLFHLAKVHEHVDFYKDSRQLESYAKTGVQAEERLAEERRKKEFEEQRKLKIRDLVAAARDLFRKKDYEGVKDKFGEILAIDPDNAEVVALRKELERLDEAHRREEEAGRVQTGINERAKRVLNEGLLAKERKRYMEAIGLFRTVLTIGAPDAQYSTQASSEILQCEAEIVALRKPLLEQAKVAEDAQDYTKAFRLFQEVLELDSTYKPAAVGMERTRQKFELVARAHYIEGVILEGLNDFEGAQRKFKQILSDYPKESIYHEKSSKRYAKYFILELLSPKPQPSPSGIPDGPPLEGGMPGGVSPGTSPQSAVSGGSAGTVSSAGESPGAAPSGTIPVEAAGQPGGTIPGDTPGSASVPAASPPASQEGKNP
jgi:pSer/pThr/pTyr-binding forkhead associated (FHA) protein/tetratricopeptide (TPR) repeat protein